MITYGYAEAMDSTDTFFRSVYRRDSCFGSRPPWDIGGPQPALVELVEAGLVGEVVLDAGFGPAGLSCYLAARGHTVTGIDQSAEAVAAARARAGKLGLRVTFEVGDLLDLSAYPGRFDTVLECGVIHGLTPAEQVRYAASLHRATAPGARAHLLNLSPAGDREARARCAGLGVPPPILTQLHAVTAEQLRAAFADGWQETGMAERTLRVVFPGDPEPTELPALLASFRRA